MEEKERYEIKDRWLVDTENNYKQIYAIDSYIDRPVIDLLNLQDKQIKELQEELALTKNALELACEPRDDWGGTEYFGTEYDNYYDYFMAQAKEMLKNE